MAEVEAVAWAKRWRVFDGTAQKVKHFPRGRGREKNVAEAEVPGQINGPIAGYVTVIVRPRASAGELVSRHAHRGIAST